MEAPETAVHYDSDWTAIYVVIGAIPVVFVGVALYTTWRERIRARRALRFENFDEPIPVACHLNSL
ncbi:hypothetical protein F4808DRAFT_460293 [Astrocystis sublimbata]|nr:hypothetical protein F4808DRAFT_460293 [Astrocystis sublimbata]